MENLEKSKKHILELLILLYFDVFAIWFDFLTRNIAMALYSYIIGSFLQSLCME